MPDKKYAVKSIQFGDNQTRQIIFAVVTYKKFL